jgi:hypothetical protein
VGPALLALLVGSFCPETPVAVIPSIAGAVDPPLTAIHRVGERAVRERSCFSTLPFEASSALEAVIDRCGSDEACIDDSLVGARARAGLLIVLVKTGDRWLLSVRWQEVGRSHRALNETIQSPELETIALLVIRLLDEVGLVRGARLAVKVSPENATTQLSRDGTAVPLVTEVVVPSGKYRLQVAAEDHRAEARELELAPGESLALSIELEEVRAVYQEWWFWTAIGVAVAGGAVAIGLTASRKPSCLCSAGSFERCEILCDDL